MLVKRCVLCRRPSFTTRASGAGRKWMCPSCRESFAESVLVGGVPQGGQICRKCKKRNSSECRFTLAERDKIKACSDFISKNAEREKRRWAKFEVRED